MSDHEHLVLIACDISDAKDRQRVAEFLEARMTRVQDSLFEGWMSAWAGQRTAQEAAGMIDAADSLRLYIVPAGGVGRCAAWGFPPAPEAGGMLIV